MWTVGISDEMYKSIEAEFETLQNEWRLNADTKKSDSINQKISIQVKNIECFCNKLNDLKCGNYDPLDLSLVVINGKIRPHFRSLKINGWIGYFQINFITMEVNGIAVFKLPLDEFEVENLITNYSTDD